MNIILLYRSETIAQDQQIVIVFITIIILMVMLYLYCKLICIWKFGYIFMQCIIFPQSIFPSCSVTTYPVYTAIDCEMY
jgi:hypothetical protein